MSKAESNSEHMIAVGGRYRDKLQDKPLKIRLFSEQIPDWLKKAKDPGVLLIEHPIYSPPFQASKAIQTII